MVSINSINFLAHILIKSMQKAQKRKIKLIPLSLFFLQLSVGVVLCCVVEIIEDGEWL